MTTKPATAPTAYSRWIEATESSIPLRETVEAIARSVVRSADREPFARDYRDGLRAAMVIAIETLCGPCAPEDLKSIIDRLIPATIDADDQD